MAELGGSVETWSRLLLLCRSTHTKTSSNGVLRDSVRTSPTPSERAFRDVRKIAASEYKLRVVCLSVRPHGTTRFLLDQFSWNLILEDFSKIGPENTNFIKILQE